MSEAASAAKVKRLWHDVSDDIHRNDADSGSHVALTEPVPPSVQLEADGRMGVCIPVRAGVDVTWLETQLLEVQKEHNTRRMGPGGAFLFTSSRVAVCCFPVRRQRVQRKRHVCMS